MSDYGFEENTDYVVTDIFVHNSLGGRQYQTDHIITLDMAKEIATHVDEEDKTTTLIQGAGSNYKLNTVIINESNL
ncbi:phage anti-repressor protein [Mammaliicoccus lentus]|jgi:phage anti-repressor protein